MARPGLLGPIRGIPSLAVPPRSDASEMLDEVGHDPGELAANLRDIRRVNKLLGGTSTTLRHVPGLLHRLPPRQTATVLDLATGSADIPIALHDWANRQIRPLEITASDYSDEILDVARAQIGSRTIALVKHDARAVPLPDHSFDIVLCSLSLHHFSPADAVRVLGEMRRLSRVGFVLNDLRRGRLGYGAAWAAVRMTTRNRLTQHDAPLSVMRAYTPDELRELLREAGVSNARITNHLWFRMAAVVVDGGAHV